MTQLRHLTPADVILGDHRRLRGLLHQFDVFEQKGSELNAQLKCDLGQEILTTIKAEADRDRKIFYPELLKKIGGEKWAAERAIVGQAVDELSRLQELCEAARSADPGSSGAVLQALLTSCEEVWVLEETKIIPLVTQFVPQLAQTSLAYRLQSNVITKEVLMTQQEAADQKTDRPKKGRGFAAMDAEKQRQIASMGGKAAHQKGTAHEFSSEEAREAGRKGGVARSNSNRKRAQEAAGQNQSGTPSSSEPSANS